MIESNPSDSLPPYHNFREGVDVICDRGEHAKRFNGHYRDLIRQFFPAYNRSTSAALKRMLAHEICTIVKSRGGKFYKDGKELTSDEAHKKVMKALKDRKRKPLAEEHFMKLKKDKQANSQAVAKAKSVQAKKKIQKLHHQSAPPPRGERERDHPAFPPTRDEWQRDHVERNICNCVNTRKTETLVVPDDSWVGMIQSVPEALTQTIWSRDFSEFVRTSSNTEPLPIRTKSRERSDLAKMTEQDLQVLADVSSWE